MKHPDRRVMVFGGAFNPPTLAHEAVIAACLGLPECYELWLLPSGDRADKRISATDRDRLAMLGILKAERFGGDPRLQVSDFELRLPRPTQTATTAAALAERYPHAVFWFVFGLDSYLSMPQWQAGAELQKRLPMIIFSRKTSQPLPLAGTVRFLKLPLSVARLSSTQVRRAVRAGDDIGAMVSPPIERYINQHRLYSAQPSPEKS